MAWGQPSFGKLGCSQFSSAKKLGYDVVGLRPNDGLTDDSIFWDQLQWNCETWEIASSYQCCVLSEHEKSRAKRFIVAN